MPTAASRRRFIRLRPGGSWIQGPRPLFRASRCEFARPRPRSWRCHGRWCLTPTSCRGVVNRDPLAPPPANAGDRVPSPSRTLNSCTSTFARRRARTCAVSCIARQGPAIHGASSPRRARRALPGGVHQYRSQRGSRCAALRYLCRRRFVPGGSGVRIIARPLQGGTCAPTVTREQVVLHAAAMSSARIPAGFDDRTGRSRLRARAGLLSSAARELQLIVDLIYAGGIAHMNVHCYSSPHRPSTASPAGRLIHSERRRGDDGC
jgi:hypothetical protein